MEPISATGLLLLVVSAVSLLIGILLGSRRSRRSRRRLQLELNEQSLQLLDARSELSGVQKQAIQQPRKDRLLALSLQRLKKSNQQVQYLADAIRSQEKRHFIQLAKLRMRGVEAADQARQATRIARKATAHLKRIEQESPVTQTIKAHEPKSYGNGEAVTVSVVDQTTLEARHDAVTRVSNRDSARLTQLRSSNEGRRPPA